MPKSPLPSRLGPYAAAIAALGLALPASAAVIDGLSAFASAKVFGNLPVTAGPNTGTPSTSASASALGSDVNGNQSNANGSAFGAVNGVYGVGANGVGVFDASGRFIRSWNITNDSGTALLYSFVFYIYGGSMTADELGAGGSGYAEYDLKINWGGNSLFASAAKITSNGVLTESGTQLEGAMQSGTYSYSWSGTQVGLNLGLLNPGESRLLEYDLIGHAFGDYGFTDDCGNGYGVPSGPSANFVGIVESCAGISRVFMGDPSGLDGEPPVPGAPHVTSRPAAVPEPGSVGLIGLGLMAMLGLWRRRAQGEP